MNKNNMQTLDEEEKPKTVNMGLVEIKDEISQINKKHNNDFNQREFETDVTELVGKITLDDNLRDQIKKEITEMLENIKKDENLKNDKGIAFTLFFVLFTICRRQQLGDINELIREYDGDFDEYYMMEHIRLMAILNTETNPFYIYKAIKKSNNLINSSACKDCFKNHVGVLNVYVELICKYFENKIDERFEPENIAMIKNGKDYIDNIFDIQKNQNTDYSKFHLNLGRILVLLGEYNDGEKEIRKGISQLPFSTDRQSKVNEYNQYLIKASIIKAYDLSDEKNRELEKIKVDNYKSLAVITTLLGFLLGTINIFSQIEDTSTLLLLMLSYWGLLLVLLGIVLLGLSSLSKGKKKLSIIYSVCITLLGVIIFIAGILFTRGV